MFEFIRKYPEMVVFLNTILEQKKVGWMSKFPPTEERINFVRVANSNTFFKECEYAIDYRVQFATWLNAWATTQEFLTVSNFDLTVEEVNSVLKMGGIDPLT